MAARSASGHGQDELWGKAGDGSGAQLWDRVPGHGLPGRGPRTDVREDMWEGGPCPRAGRHKEKTARFQRQSSQQLAIPPGAA